MATETEGGGGSVVVTGISLASSAGSAVLRAATALGRKLSPVFLRAGTHFGTAATIAAAAYQVHGENSARHKEERAVAGAASAGVNLALGGAAASTAESAALAGVAGATGSAVVAAAAPVVLGIAAAAATAEVADLAIENRRVYEKLDSDEGHEAAPAKILNRTEAEKPLIGDYKHLGGMLGVTAHMRESALHVRGKIERWEGSNRIRNFSAIDMTDPQNLAEYERALEEEISRQKVIMRQNDSVLPRWIRHGDSLTRYNFAEGELRNLTGARDELALFKEDVRAYRVRCEEAVTTGDRHPANRQHSARRRANETSHDAYTAPSPGEGVVIHDVVARGALAPAMNGTLTSGFGSAVRVDDDARGGLQSAPTETAHVRGGPALPTRQVS